MVSLSTGYFIHERYWYSKKGFWSDGSPKEQISSLSGFEQMVAESRESRHIKIKPSVLRKARHHAIDSHKTLGEWLEEAIEQKLDSEFTAGTHAEIESKN